MNKYMFSYFLSHNGNKGYEKAGKRARRSWNKFRSKVLRNTVRSEVKPCLPDMRELLQKKYLYLDMGEGLFLVLRGKTVANAKLTKDWRAARKKGYIL
ncbi:hypothetical protein [Anaerosporobacter sp.]